MERSLWYRTVGATGTIQYARAERNDRKYTAQYVCSLIASKDVKFVICKSSQNRKG